MTYIKPDPEMQEEQEDLIMSYLNADYLSTDTPLSPPSSTSSSSETTGSPEKHCVDDFMLDINSTDFLNTVDHPWAATSTNNNSDILFNPCLPQQHQSQHQIATDLLNAFPFFLPTMGTTTPPAQFISPFPNQSDPEQPKKKRGRKKREPVAQNTLAAQPSLLAPKPLAPRPKAASIQIKTEPINMDQQLHQEKQTLAGPTSASTSSSSSSTPVAAANAALKQSAEQPSLEAQKAAQIQKRQERLIKNRAAALLSRKRKREHLSSLEEEKQVLVMENEKLVHKVDTLEHKVEYLEKENSDLKEQLKKYQEEQSTSPTTIIHLDGNNKRHHLLQQQKHSKATGVVFMIILFSFALFTLPSRTADRLTVGGSSVLENKKQFPLIGSSSSSVHELDYTVEQYCQQHSDYCDESMLISNENTNLEQENTTDLVLIDSVRPRDLQTWINHKLDASDSNNLAQNENANRLVSWFPATTASGSNNAEINDSHVNLYSKEFSQLASLHKPQGDHSQNSAPTISLFSPFNQTADNEDQCDSYLQIDVQVLHSTVIKGQLMSLQQYGSASTTLLDGMKDLIAHNNNVTRSNRKRASETFVKREKRTKKISRVII